MKIKSFKEIVLNKNSDILENDIEKDIFIRHLSKKELNSVSKRAEGRNSLPQKDGYTIGYKPYGNSGDRKDQGFYYIKN